MRFSELPAKPFVYVNVLNDHAGGEKSDISFDIIDCNNDKSG